MNNEMAYLLGMIMGNGEIKRNGQLTTISISIPHKKLQTEDENDVHVYVAASVTNIRNVLEPLISKDLSFIQNKSKSILTFTKNSEDYLIREILQFVDNIVSCENMRIPDHFFESSKDIKLSFLRGFSDVTGYIRRSNYFFDKYMHRVYIEVPHNWYMVVDICNLLSSIDIPVQNIDWAHPNMRDGNLKKYNQGNINFWKKEHQIKIWANEFIPIGFAVIHKNKALQLLATELINGLHANGKNVSKKTHKFYWENRKSKKEKSYHPSESDEFIPIEIRNKHYNSWQSISYDLGYKER